MELEDDWHKIVGGKKSQADFAQFQKLLPEKKNEKVLARYGKVEAFPHLFVLEKNGKLLHSQDTGLLETGDHHDSNKVIPFLKKWAPN